MANYKKILSFVRKWEGGLSRKTSDTASKNPSPCSYNGQTGWHTNKGVTWIAFKSQSKLGYYASCDNFIEMPDNIWEKIFKSSYWDKFYLDDMKSQAIANFILGYAWGSGVSGSYSQLKKFFLKEYGITITSRENLKDTINELTTSKITKTISASKERKLFDQMVAYKVNYLISLGQPQNLTGWLNRMDEFKSESEKYLGKANVNKILYIGGAFIIVSIAGIIIMSVRKK